MNEIKDPKNEIKTPWGEIGYLTYKRTYARNIKNGTEEFPQTIQRELDGIDKQLKLNLTEEEKDFYKKIRLQLKGSVAGRFMWQLGTKTVDRLGLASLQNCAFTVVNDPVRPFTWAMDMLMLGSGVGYSIKKEHVFTIPKVKNKIKVIRQDDASADFIVPDTREGWVKLLGRTLKAHFYGGVGFTYSTQLIRGKGAAIKGFGGTASGAEELCWGIEEINNILNKRSNRKIRPIDCLDIMNIIGKIVVAGNVRRSAQISIGDSDDLEYLKAKRWDLGNIPNWRNMSNNSIDCENIEDLSQEFWDTYNQGEPYGLINLRLSRLIGRLGETQYPDPEVEGYNPCAEQSLADKETCCLAEIYLPNIESEDEFFEVAKILYKINKHSLAMSCHNKETEDIVNKNMRMGIGVTGVMMCTDEKLSWLDPVYNKLREFDKEYSNLMGFPESIKITTLKPSGCSKESTLLITKNGLLTLGEIGDINGDRWQEHSVEICQEHNSSNSDKFFVNGKVATKKIYTSGGIELESSLTHQYRVIRNNKYVWVKSFDIKIGDIMPFKVGGYSGGSIQQLINIEYKKTTNLKYINQPTEINEDIAWLLGLYLADGSTHKKGIRIAGDLSKRFILEKASKIIKEQFNIDCIIYDRGNGNNSDLYANSKMLLNYLKANDLIKPKTIDIEIPLVIRKSPVNIIHKYIDGYGMGDGSLQTHCRTFCTISKIMASQLVVVLRSIGIDAKCRLMPPTEISYGSNMRYWISERKGRNADGRYIKKDTRSVWDTLDKLGLKEFNFDIVEDIQDGETETYDISVPDNHTYIAESYVNHNTLSLLAGVTPGVHPAPAGPYYIRRVRIASDSNLIDVCKDNGYDVEFQKNFDGSIDNSTYVVSFPCKIPEWVKIGKDVDVLDQLDMVKFMQKNWSDNSVSVTAYYKKEDIPRIKEYLKENWRDNFKTLSFLLYHGHGFDQAPYEEISKEIYEDMRSRVKDIVSVEVLEDDVKDSLECEGGMCPVK